MLIVLLAVIISCVSVIIVLSCEDMSNWLGNICAVVFIAQIMVMIFCVPFIIVAQCNTNKKIYIKQLEYESLIKQCQIISSEYEDVSKANVIQNVYEWNKEVYDAKYWADNLWTNWFYNQKVVESLEYINLEDYGL